MRLVPDTQFNLQLGATSDWTIVGLVLLLGALAAVQLLIYSEVLALCGILAIVGSLLAVVQGRHLLAQRLPAAFKGRSEEHTSELQSH